MNNVRLEAENIVFSYGGPPILNGVSVNVEAGELFAVVGPSGSGKTTLLRVIAGLEQPTAGRILVNGQNATEIPVPQRSVGVVFQDFSLWPHMSVFDNVAFGLSGKDPAGRAVKERVLRILSVLGIESSRDMRPHQLSAGQQQRVALARALVTEPRLLLLDDPFSNLEAGLRVQMRHDLRALQRKLGITAILVTHDLEDALSIADRMAVVMHGTVRQVGTPASVFDFPNSIEVAQFVGVENFLAGTLRHAETQLIEFFSPHVGALRWPTSDRPPPGPSVLGIRPHALHLCPIDSFRDGRYSWLEGSVVTSEFLGEAVRYQIAVGDTVLSVRQPHFPGSAATPAGTPVLVGVDPARARIFPCSPEDAIGLPES